MVNDGLYMIKKKTTWKLWQFYSDFSKILKYVYM